ncbi:MAG: hypothetical protein IKY33_01930 [Clostridia bacterium]|nr:hypothetical protein [Clostridia bacterium]
MLLTIERKANTGGNKEIQLVLDTSVYIRARFTTGADTEYVKVTAENGQAWIIPLSECEFISETDGYDVYFTACDADGNAVSNTLRYSICPLPPQQNKPTEKRCLSYHRTNTFFMNNEQLGKWRFCLFPVY